jgi:hypothetical protein
VEGLLNEAKLEENYQNAVIKFTTGLEIAVPFELEVEEDLGRIEENFTGNVNEYSILNRRRSSFRRRSFSLLSAMYVLESILMMDVYHDDHNHDFDDDDYDDDDGDINGLYLIH